MLFTINFLWACLNLPRGISPPPEKENASVGSAAAKHTVLSLLRGGMGSVLSYSAFSWGFFLLSKLFLLFSLLKLYSFVSGFQGRRVLELTPKGSVTVFRVDEDTVNFPAQGYLPDQLPIPEEPSLASALRASAH